MVPKEAGSRDDRRRPAEPELIEQVARLIRGDRSALSAIVRLSQNRLYRFCFHLTGSQQAAEELAQDTLVKALTRLDDLRDPAGVYPWLFRVARNLFIDETRSTEGKLRKLELREDPEAEGGLRLDSLPSSSPGNAELLVAIQATLMKLKPEEREVILLVDYEEHSYDEAAQVIGISESAVRSRLHRARKAFFELYDGKAGKGAAR